MILLLSNSTDLATDLVVAELIRRERSYHRIDSDLIHNDEVILDPIARVLEIRTRGRNIFVAADEVESLLFRAPTYLRESSAGRHTPEELLQRHQWTAFIRSLMVFDNAVWVNHPARVYVAENKPYQLMCAARSGFEVPPTRIANNVPPAELPVWNAGYRVAIKALDSFLLRVEDTDAFFYTRDVSREELGEGTLQSIPVILQRLLEPKIDIRVTVVDEMCFPIAVTRNGAGIVGDWRLQKLDATFSPCDLPASVQEACAALMRSLHLEFGAIDLALVNGVYYFLEINPTGEWAWLVESAGMRIDEALVNRLCVPTR